jgi:hypothetical protein
MELTSPLDFLEECRRPRHLRVDQWLDQRLASARWREWEEQFPKKKHRNFDRMLDRWWHKPVEPAALLRSEKLVEAKRERFTTEGKEERIAKSLAALKQPPSIRLASTEWRRIVEDPDLEDQFL